MTSHPSSSIIFPIPVSMSEAIVYLQEVFWSLPTVRIHFFTL